MEFNGEFELEGVEPENAWVVLSDPIAVRDALKGCRYIVPMDDGNFDFDKYEPEEGVPTLPDVDPEVVADRAFVEGREYAALMQIGVGSVKPRFGTRVTIAEREYPTMVATGGGADSDSSFEMESGMTEPHDSSLVDRVFSSVRATAATATAPRVTVEMFPPNECETAFAGADVCFITGSTLVYGGLNRYLSALESADVPLVALVGATASFVSGPAFDAGIDLVAGARVRNPASVRASVRAGDCGTDLHDSGLEKVYVTRNSVLPGLSLDAGRVDESDDQAPPSDDNG